MNNTLFAILLLLVGFAAQAQTEVVVIHANGSVQYYAPNQKTAKSIYPGMRLSVHGSIRCQSGASVKLLYRKETITLSDGKLYALSQLDKQVSETKGIGFSARFWSFISGCMQQTTDGKTLEENHRRYMESVYAGVKGYSRTAYALQASRLCAGSLGHGTVTFRWAGGQAGQVLRFRIMQGENILISAQVRDSSFSVNLSQLALEPGMAYQWQVLSPDDAATAPRSAVTAFAYNPEALDQTLDQLYKDHEYQHALPTEQALMQAFVLEDAGFLYQAATVYQDAAQANPQNGLLRDAHAAFLARMDMLADARQKLETDLGWNVEQDK